jgi:hypothetical protein
MQALKSSQYVNHSTSTGEDDWKLGTAVLDSTAQPQHNLELAYTEVRSQLAVLEEDVLSLKFAVSNLNFVADLEVTYNNKDLQVSEQWV